MSRRTALHWLAAVLAPAAATAACQALDGRMSVAGLAMVYLLAVAATATALDRAPGLAASLLCVSALNFFFVPPRRSFAIDGAEYWWTLAVLLGLSLALNTLIGHLRAGRLRAEAGQARAAALHALGELLAGCDGPEDMARRGAQWLHGALGHPCAVFLRQEGAPPACFGAPGGAAFQARPAAWAIEHGRALGRGCADWPELPLWCAPFAAHGAGGAVQVLLPGQARPDGAAAAHWQALARQLGLAIERERAAALARAASDEARAEAARNTLLASLSHDLRTPLAAIVGSASTLRAQGAQLGAAERERLLASLEDEARDMTLMADNILQLARLSQPRWRLHTQWESLEDVLGAAVARMRRRWPAARIQLRVAPGLPPVQAEAALLAQVLANLVDNAVRHAGTGQPIAIQAGRARDGVFVAVRDHGPGTGGTEPAQLLARGRLGEPGPAGGAGLGLAICQLIVQAHGGRMDARRCEPGTEFRIDLPAAPQAGEQAHAA